MQNFDHLKPTAEPILSLTEEMNKVEAAFDQTLDSQQQIIRMNAARSTKNLAGIKPPAVKKKSNKEMRFNELMKLTRKLKPHLSKAIITASQILEDSEARHQDQLKASALIIQTYRDLVKDLYDYRYDNEEAQEEVQGNTLFSLTMVEETEDAKILGERNN